MKTVYLALMLITSIHANSLLATPTDGACYMEKPACLEKGLCQCTFIEEHNAWNCYFNNSLAERGLIDGLINILDDVLKPIPLPKI